jgi:ABC-type sulfate transport system permease subunit
MLKAVLLVELAILVFIFASLWKVFTKAGQPGWAVFIPIYNAYVLLKIAGKPGWWLILFFIPIVNIIVGILVAIAVSENFGKGIGFAIGLMFLPFIFYPILGFGDAQYTGGIE